LGTTKTLLIVSYIDYPYYSGLSKRISGLTKVLAAKGVPIKLLAPIARLNVVLDRVSSNITICRIDLRKFKSTNPEKFISKFILWLLFSLRATIFLIKEYARSRCLIQYESIYSAFPTLMVKVLLGARIIGDDILPARSFIYYPILKLTDHVVTSSAITYMAAKQLGKHSLYVPNGVELRIHKRLSPRNKAKALFVGTLTFDQNLKAVKNIIKLATNLDKKGFELEIVIVGGPLKVVEHLIYHPLVKRGKVKFLGRVSESKLKELYSCSFIGLLPFFQDTPLRGGQRTKALEFFANGLLVISGPEGVKGIRGLEQGKHYLLANSLDEMCEVMTRVLSEPEAYQKIAQEGESFIHKNYSWEILTKHYVKVIQCLISNQSTTFP
jgi:glycosyltransferase involved in cell wall biosynthesis